MASNLIDPIEIAQDWGGDLQLTPTGDLATTSLVDRSKKRVLRRLLTNPGDYIFHPTYGAGLGRFVGLPVDRAKMEALIIGQMFLEASVIQSPRPTVSATAVPNGLVVDIAYLVGPEKIPAVLSFTLNP